jgi:methionyl-tRNA formyltransferase
VRLLFIGTGDIGLPTLRDLFASPDHNVIGCVTQPDKPAGRHQELRVSPIKELALHHHARIFQPAKIRDRGAIEQLQFLRPDVIVVMAYGQILPGEILRIPSVACLNLHASLLPRHRGAAPIQAAIEAGDTNTGITVMYMDEGLDTGDILLKKEIRIRRRETAGTLHDRLAALAPAALQEALSLLKQGRAPRHPQDASQATYAQKLGREHGEIRWSATHEEIDRKVRGMNPWPGAFTLIPTPHGTRKLKVFSCIQHSRAQGQPGEVLRTGKDGILVAAGRGAVLLRDVQPEGKRRMPADEFLHGNPIAAGSLLGASQ